jgi:adenosylcobinamide-phosphate synthase
MTMRRDHASTESPNAGWTMSAAAGLLGVVLEKQGHYRLGAEFREPESSDVRRATRLMYFVAALGVLVTSMLVLARQGLLS